MRARENNSGLIGGGRRGKRGERRECEFTCLDLIPFRSVIGSHGESARSGAQLSCELIPLTTWKVPSRPGIARGEARPEWAKFLPSQGEITGEGEGSKMTHVSRKNSPVD